MEEEKKHRLVVIGFLGDKTCYLDISRDEAIRRYERSYGPAEDCDINDFRFDDDFGAYDVWGE